MSVSADFHPEASIFDQCFEDFEMQKSLMMAVWKMARSEIALDVIEASDFMTMLAGYVQVKSKRGWSESQLYEIQALAIAILSELGPNMIDKFNSLGCIERVLRFFAW